MVFKTGKGFKSLADNVEKLIGHDVGLQQGLSNVEIAVGLSSEPEFGVPVHAVDTAIYAGDEALIGDKQINAATEAMLKQHPDKVQMKPMWNRSTGKFDIKFAMAGDADFDPIAGQTFSPWNIAYLSRIWKEPLAYSRAKEMVMNETAAGNPWAEIFTLFLEQYAGWGVIGQTGSLQNTLANDVNVMNGMMSAPIINMMGTYSVTREELERKGWGPVGSSPIGRKQSYLNYVFDMMDCILIYFGNEDTNTPGLFDINPIRSWDPAKSMKAIYTGTSTTKGSDAYMAIAEVLNDYLTSADNKWNKIKIAVSPEAYNYLQSMPYSANFSAEAVMRTFGKNYLAGKGPNGSDPSITFVADPLLKAGSPFNPTDHDYMVITSPTVDGGPDKESQPTNIYATALKKFVFPVIPGMYNHQYKALRRVAGIMAPIPDAVRIYAGFGVQ